MSDSTDTPKIDLKTVPAERAQSADSAEPTLGRHLSATREKRGISRDQAVSETHIPRHYIVMLEGGDYSLVSDQLYLMPFLRRYATFLGLDPEEAAMRFLRETQNAESSVVKISEPIVSAHASRRVGRWIIAMLAVLVIAAAAWYFASHPLRRRVLKIGNGASLPATLVHGARVSAPVAASHPIPAASGQPLSVGPPATHLVPEKPKPPADTR